MVGLTLAIIYLNDEIKSYLLVVIIFGSAVGITAESWLAYNSGFEFGGTKVHPELISIDDERPQKKIYGEEKDGYF